MNCSECRFNWKHFIGATSTQGVKRGKGGYYGGNGKDYYCYMFFAAPKSCEWPELGHSINDYLHKSLVEKNKPENVLKLG